MVTIARTSRIFKDLETRIDGEPALMVRVLRVGRQDALDIRARVAGARVSR